MTACMWDVKQDGRVAEWVELWAARGRDAGYTV